MAKITEYDIKLLDAELARTTKPKAYVQFYCDDAGWFVTAYDRDISNIEDPSEYKVFQIVFIVGRDATDEEYEDAYDEVLSEVASLLIKHGWSPEFHSLEDIHYKIDHQGKHNDY